MTAQAIFTFATENNKCKKFYNDDKGKYDIRRGNQEVQSSS